MQDDAAQCPEQQAPGHPSAEGSEMSSWDSGKHLQKEHRRGWEFVGGKRWHRVSPRCLDLGVAATLPTAIRCHCCPKQKHVPANLSDRPE